MRARGLAGASTVTQRGLAAAYQAGVSSALARERARVNDALFASPQGVYPTSVKGTGFLYGTGQSELYTGVDRFKYSASSSSGLGPVKVGAGVSAGATTGVAGGVYAGAGPVGFSAGASINPARFTAGAGAQASLGAFQVGAAGTVGRNPYGVGATAVVGAGPLKAGAMVGVNPSQLSVGAQVGLAAGPVRMNAYTDASPSTFGLGMTTGYGYEATGMSMRLGRQSAPAAAAAGAAAAPRRPALLHSERCEEEEEKVREQRCVLGTPEATMVTPDGCPQAVPQPQRCLGWVMQSEQAPVIYLYRGDDEKADALRMSDVDCVAFVASRVVDFTLNVYGMPEVDVSAPSEEFRGKCDTYKVESHVKVDGEPEMVVFYAGIKPNFRPDLPHVALVRVPAPAAPAASATTASAGASAPSLSADEPISYMSLSASPGKDFVLFSSHRVIRGALTTTHYES